MHTARGCTPRPKTERGPLYRNDAVALSQSSQGAPKLVAARDLSAGELAFTVPWRLTITLERVLEDGTLAELLTTNKLSELSVLALYLCYEKMLGKSSFWSPVLRLIDARRAKGPDEVESPLLWSDEELAWLSGSPMQRIIEERRAGIKQEYEELDTIWYMAGSLFDKYPYDLPTQQFSFKTFLGAFAAVQSSVVHLQGVGTSRRFALCPLAPPLARWDPRSRAMMRGKCAPGADDGVDSDAGDAPRRGPPPPPAMECAAPGVSYIVDREVKAGEPISVWCGPQPNSKLLLNYGIVDDLNPHDRLAICIQLNPDDPLFQAKRLAVQEELGLGSSSEFQLFRDASEPWSPTLLPFLRIAMSADHGELSACYENAAADEISEGNERRARAALARYASSKLQAYPTTMLEDDDIAADESQPLKRRLVARLVRIEKATLSRVASLIDGCDEVELPEYTPRINAA